MKQLPNFNKKINQTTCKDRTLLQETFNRHCETITDLRNNYLSMAFAMLGIKWCCYSNQWTVMGRI
jgi:hypothetical protein